MFKDVIAELRHIRAACDAALVALEGGNGTGRKRGRPAGSKNKAKPVDGRKQGYRNGVHWTQTPDGQKTLEAMKRKRAAAKRAAEREATV